MSFDASRYPNVKHVAESIFEFGNRGIREGSRVDFGHALAILCAFTNLEPEAILALCKEGFDERKYYKEGGILPPVEEMIGGVVSAEEIVCHWLAYWGLLAVLCDEGSTAPSGLPWLSLWLGSCISANLIQLPDGFQAK